MSGRVFAVLLAFAGLAAAAAAAPESAPRPLGNDPRVVDAVAAWETWVAYQLAIQRVPGASTGIVHDQQLLSSRGYGAANPEAGIAAAPDTLYSICSISKLFTSIALMQLRDAGKLRLDDPVALVQQIHGRAGPAGPVAQKPADYAELDERPVRANTPRRNEVGDNTVVVARVQRDLFRAA